MGVHATHYVVLGVVINKEKFKDFRKLEEENYEFFEQFDDNSYEEKITSGPNNINIIVDGMSGEYIVIGKIIAKGLDGLPFTTLDIDQKVVYETGKAIYELFEKFNYFEWVDVKYIAFTHWH